MDKYLNRLLRHGTEIWHRNLRSDLVLVNTRYIGTGAILVPGFVPNQGSRLTFCTGAPNFFLRCTSTKVRCTQIFI